MKISDARSIVRMLANGQNPLNREDLPPESIYQDANVTRALYLAEVALERMERREARGEQQPKNAGKAWTSDEDTALAAAFAEGGDVKALADRYGRTPYAIHQRLVKLGKIDPYEQG